MTFVTFFRKCRQALGLRQCDFLPDFKQSYISQIENGVRPNNAETYHKLAKHLKLGPQGGDFLWAYARFDQDPREIKIPQIDPADISIREERDEYLLDTAETREILIGFTTDEVLRVLGAPDDEVRFENKEKWIYKEKAIHIIFQDDKLIDVLFK